MLIKLIDGGSLKDEYIRISLVLPSFQNSEVETIHGYVHKETAANFPTEFRLTRNPVYGKILFSILGLGLCLEWHQRIDD